MTTIIMLAALWILASLALALLLGPWMSDDEVCDRCGILKRPEGGHRCGSCGDDI